MKVCLFTDTLGDLNGVSRFIQDMGEQAFLANKNASASETLNGVSSDFELKIITATSKPIPDKPYIQNLNYHFKMPMPFYQELDLVWPNRKAIRHFLNLEQPDIVHISTPGPFGWVAKAEAQKLNIPLMGTYHTDFPAYLYDLTKSRWVKRQTNKIMARFYHRFKHVFSRSDAYLEIMRQDIRLDSQEISTLFPGTNLNRFHPKHQNADIWSRFGLSSDRLKVLYVGRINIEKNIPFLLDTWQSLLEQSPDLNADLILVGEGRFRKYADKMHPHHVHFLGPVEGKSLSALYASSDVFVFPSVTDTLGQVIMEAQASGLGCLVSDVGGPQTLIQHNKTGRILKANHKEKWQQALHEVLSTPELRLNWRHNSRPNIETYDIVKSFEQFRQQHF